jgi:peptidoglycan/LPS O-acetylase OafA/YrhL
VHSRSADFARPCPPLKSIRRVLGVYYERNRNRIRNAQPRPQQGQTSGMERKGTGASQPNLPALPRPSEQDTLTRQSMSGSDSGTRQTEGGPISQPIGWPRESETSLRERTFRPDIEGLRAIAVLAVVLFHAGVPGIRGGYVGVDIFFVLSGFLITGLLLREHQRRGSVSLPAFYARRARRILPAATLVLIVTVLATYYWLGYIRGAVTALDGRWTAAFAANLRFALQGTDYFGHRMAPSPLRHYWSLAVEEQFYLVWPALLLLTATVARGVALRKKLVAVLAVIVIGSFGWSVVETRMDPVWAFFSPLTRAWELGIGALLALGTTWLRRLPDHLGPWLSWAGLLAVLLSLVLLTSRTAFPGYAAALPVLGTALVIIAGTLRPASGAEAVLGRAPLQWLGKASYSWYLTHWPVLIIAGALAMTPLSLCHLYTSPSPRD